MTLSLNWSSYEKVVNRVPVKSTRVIFVSNFLGSTTSGALSFFLQDARRIITEKKITLREVFINV